ncbi:anti-sigma factor [Membranicola marinus]|uniref:Regulator of SigK n=1 Tax=Membranihabitans marinus TaxID=1227546 RepID=A0A953HZ68_9BACT|nr:anti-sigma factor [Membranihabitans marinus]MBY5958397.1 anti-sigma factor [Membranihabitans marinus]
MNIKEYIASGILEAYVSGAASDQERREVECLSSVYPEIQAELNLLEDTMIGFANEYQAPPPPGLKDKIMASIGDEAQVPALKTVTDHSDEEVTDEDLNMDSSAVKRTNRDPSNFPWRIAASILLIVSCGLLYFLITLEDDYESEIESQRTNITTLQDKLDNLSHELANQQDQLAILSSPSILKIPLAAANEEEQGNALVFWDASDQNVYLDPSQLPSVDDDQQYQLWALKDNQPIDLGTVLKGDIGFQQMKKATEADAFAITLEPLGGSEQPTLEQLKVIGKI